MIRPATTADIPAVLEIWNPVIRDTVITFNPVEKTLTDMGRLLEEKATAGQAFLVADEGGQVQGFATYAQFRGGLGYKPTVEHSIILGPSARGKGVGRALMTAIEDHARAGGAHSIFAGVSGGNPDGVGFHAAIGYTSVALLPEVGYKFGKWWDLILMQKFLT
jgi:L-amino acid N-acyltransferase YncA